MFSVSIKIWLYCLAFLLVYFFRNIHLNTSHVTQIPR